MATRLDRLFLLLDTGSTPLIRKSAAEQLGEVQKLHPYELNNLLSKVHEYLKSSSWETRIAAGQAVDAITRNVPQWDTKGSIKHETSEAPVQSVGRLLFSQFDLNKVLAYGSSLLGSEEKQYDVDDKVTGLDKKEQLSKQRQILNKRLGLDVAGNLGLGSRDIFSDEDLLVGMKTHNGGQNGSDKHSVTDIVKQQLLDVTSGMSAREKNQAKRKARVLAKQRSKDCQSEQMSFDSEPPAKKSKPGDAELGNDGKLTVEGSFDNTLNTDETEEWPFESFCELLMNDLFHSSWETRHGAATGLREVIKLHGQGAGKSVDTSFDQLTTINQVWLSDLALRLLCVLALDRFGDYVSDEVVAPVRETCSQTLGVIIKFLDPDGVEGVVSVLLQLLGQTQWEVRHGGLLGFKYILAVRQDMTTSILPVILPSLFQGLQDVDDDVRAVAAAALVPVADKLVKLLPQQVPVIISCLWETLLDLDDLTASTSSIMTLLSTLLANPEAPVHSWLSHPLPDLVPRLWPFLRHNILSVRKSALETLHTLLTVNSEQNSAVTWLPQVLQDALRHIYQRSLLEENEEILKLVYEVWLQMLSKSPLDHLIAAATPWLGVWLSFSMQPSKIPFESSYLIEAKHRGRPDGDPGKVRHSGGGQQQPSKEQQYFIAGSDTVNASAQGRDLAVMQARMFSSRLLGLLCSFITKDVPNFPKDAEKPVESLAKIFTFHLTSKSAIQRFVIAQVIYEWASVKQGCSLPDDVCNKLLECLNESVYFDEIAMSFTHMQSDCKDFIAGLKQQGIDLDSVIPPETVLSVDQAANLTTTIFDGVKGSLKPKMLQTFEDRRRQLQSVVSHTSQELQCLTIRVHCSLAKAVIVLDTLPEKLNPVIRPLMDCIKKEENPNIQIEAAQSLCLLMRKCLDKNPSPNSKVVKNLCTFLCCDTSFTPTVSQPVSQVIADSTLHEVTCDKHTGILTLTKQQKTPETSKRGWLKRTPSLKSDIISPTEATEDTELQKQLRIQRRGADVALNVITRNFSEKLPVNLTSMWEYIMNPLQSISSNNSNLSEEAAQDLVYSLQVLESICPAVHSSLFNQVMDKLPSLLLCLHHAYTAVRYMAAKCLGMISQVRTPEVMTFIVEKILPSLGTSENETLRQGSCEALANVIDQLGMDLVAYIMLLVVPILGRMSDQNESVRLMATHCFATLIRLMPLEAGVPDPPDMKPSLLAQKEQQRKFLEQLMDGTKVEDYEITIPVKADLRKYQKDGVNWLGFMNKYHLHGILCDDMGLGKTLMSICVLATDYNNRDTQYKINKSPDSSPLSSIVICPPTLIGHWVYEVEKFVDSAYLNPLMYAGPPTERVRLQKKVKKHNLIVVSYDVVRNDIDFFSAITWNYCILDEGHIIKNGKTKLSKAVKQLTCNHRLILSGTPIQNNVLDLWSLFDFLMPGFLGTEKQFQARYGKPILQSRDAKSTSKEQEAGALAMESLHRQVLPFVLRRLKEDVLQDLPPKIIQDYYCDLSPLQVQLYEDFARSRAKRGVEDSVTTLSGNDQKEKKPNMQGTAHIFQALQYLRKVCNHPALVLLPSHPKYEEVTSQLKKQGSSLRDLQHAPKLTALRLPCAALVLLPSHPKYEEVTSQLKKQGSSLRDLQHAPKLTALRQLLNDCGIGATQISSSSGQMTTTDLPVVNQHRVLLFCQLKSMLDIVENDLLKSQLPSVTYLRLDGSIPAGSRHDIVNRFNNDPSIDILLLTTHVGGLGLNLTGADTVIFVEHDWNPMKDLQAMDRAHRIGQKKVVNVYRLVTRGTLEEKIMGLQKFKLTIANTVITQDNASLQTMGTDQLLDLFSLDNKKKGESAAISAGSSENLNKKESVNSILENLGDLWDEKQYESEYSMENFMKSLGK